MGWPGTDGGHAQVRRGLSLRIRSRTLLSGAARLSLGLRTQQAAGLRGLRCVMATAPGPPAPPRPPSGGGSGRCRKGAAASGSGVRCWGLLVPLGQEAGAVPQGHPSRAAGLAAAADTEAAERIIFKTLNGLRGSVCVRSAWSPLPPG